jgi:hypothetical protein
MFRSLLRSCSITAGSLTLAAAGSLLVCSGATPAQAQLPHSYIVDIPFAFSMNNQTLPAGKYVVTPSISPQSLRLKEIGGSHTGYVLVHDGDDARNEQPAMRFTRYGHAAFLRDFTGAATGLGRRSVSRCSTTAAEKRAAKDWVQTQQTFSTTTVALNAYPQH